MTAQVSAALVEEAKTAAEAAAATRVKTRTMFFGMSVLLCVGWLVVVVVVDRKLKSEFFLDKRLLDLLRVLLWKEKKKKESNKKRNELSQVDVTKVL